MESLAAKAIARRIAPQIDGHVKVLGTFLNKSVYLRAFYVGFPVQIATELSFGDRYERETVPFKAFDAIVDELSLHLISLDGEDLMYILPNDIQYLLSIFPVLKRIKQMQKQQFNVPPIPDPNELRKCAFAAFQLLMRHLTQIGTVILFIDDFQWADKDIRGN